MMLEERAVAIHVPFRFEDLPLLWCVDRVYTREEHAAFVVHGSPSGDVLVGREAHPRVM